MKLLFACGGTGGHIHPAIAIAQAFEKTEPKIKIAFCGTPNGMEKQLITECGYPFFEIPMQGLRRSFTLSNLKTAWLLLQSGHRAKKILRTYRPDLVIGTGGYVCYPILRAATKLHIPSALHESNAIPGLACKMLSKRIPIIFINFSITKQHLPHVNRISCVGNPLRQSFTSCDRALARAKLKLNNPKSRMILSFGGSLGAEHLNDAILLWMKEVACHKPQFTCIHVCGSRDFQRCQKLFSSYGLDAYPNLQLLEYLYDMPTYLCASDLAICRAGALTLSELAICQKPAILVPSPYVTNNHQYHNAQVLCTAGAAILLEEKNLSVTEINRSVTEILNFPLHYAEMQKAMASLAKQHAAEEIVQQLKEFYSF